MTSLQTAFCTLQMPDFIDWWIVCCQLKLSAGQTEHVIITSVLYDPNFFASNVDCFGQCLSAHQPNWLPNSTYFHLGFLFSICWRDTSSKDITGQSAKDFLHQFPFSHICLFTSHESVAVLPTTSLLQSSAKTCSHAERQQSPCGWWQYLCSWSWQSSWDQLSPLTRRWRPAAPLVSFLPSKTGRSLDRL